LKDSLKCFAIGSTATCKIIVSRYSGFNGFPVVNWYKKPLKALEPLSIVLQVAAGVVAVAPAAILIIFEGQFQILQRFSSSKLVLKTAESPQTIMRMAVGVVALAPAHSMTVAIP
jgi:hypothetical protein